MVETVRKPDAGCLVPVPGDPERAWKRGDVPARALARELASLWGLTTLDALERRWALPRQRGLSLHERRRNVRDSVVARMRVPADVCIVDDVYTSGATAVACATTCRRVGARRIRVVTLARAVR